MNTSRQENAQKPPETTRDEDKTLIKGWCVYRGIDKRSESGRQQVINPSLRAGDLHECEPTNWQRLTGEQRLCRGETINLISDEQSRAPGVCDCSWEGEAEWESRIQNAHCDRPIAVFEIIHSFTLLLFPMLCLLHSELYREWLNQIPDNT